MVISCFTEHFQNNTRYLKFNNNWNLSNYVWWIDWNTYDNDIHNNNSMIWSSTQSVKISPQLYRAALNKSLINSIWVICD